MATLGFSTKWPAYMDAAPTDFIPKIWKGLLVNGIVDNACIWNSYYQLAVNKFGNGSFVKENFGLNISAVIPKLHTVRKDPHNLWVPGRKIHPVVFNRTANRFQFAPVLEVKAVQDIDISYGDHRIDVFIDCKHYDGISMRDDTEHDKLLKLAKNDGFDSVEHFFEWFNKDFTGKIIHWTNLKY